MKSIIWDEFSYTWSVIIVFILLMLLTAIRKMSIFVKFNSFGVVFTVIIITFVLSTGIYALTKGKYEFPTYLENTDGQDPTDDISRLALFSGNIGPLMGILGGGYYLHNISLNIY